jgi:hypothetical protein
VSIYDRLMDIAPSAVVALNRAIALAAVATRRRRECTSRAPSRSRATTRSVDSSNGGCTLLPSECVPPGFFVLVKPLPVAQRAKTSCMRGTSGLAMLSSSNPEQMSFRSRPTRCASAANSRGV